MARLRHPRPNRAFFALSAAFGALLLAAACSTIESGLGEEEFVNVGRFKGAIAGDEPTAVRVGREILAAGGNAADAAVAMFFAMNATLPSRVGMGGGGICVIFDGGDEPKGDSIEFLPRIAQSGASIPMSVRGMEVLQARYGALRWSGLVAPAENLAAIGVPVSRALARDIAAAADKIMADPGLRSVFVRSDGTLVQEGDTIIMNGLQQTLAYIRQGGAEFTYQGAFTDYLAQGSTQLGLPLRPAEITGVVPNVAAPLTIQTTGFAGFGIGGDTGFFSPPPSAGGVGAAQAWVALTEVQDYTGAEDVERLHLLAETSIRTAADRITWFQDPTIPAESLASEERVSGLMRGYNSARHTPSASLQVQPAPETPDPFAAGFVVVDRWANAVACSLTMNGLFGAGRMIGPAGYILPGPAVQGSYPPAMLTAAVVGNLNTGDFRMAVVATGGEGAAPALATTLLEALEDDTDIEYAIAGIRAYNPGTPDVTYVEAGANVEALTALGHTVEVVPGGIGRINAIFCPDGVIDDSETCQVATDRRGFGYALGVN